MLDSFFEYNCKKDRLESAHDFVLLTIPAGTTGKIQPLNVFGFYGKILLNILNKRISSCF